MTFIPDDEKLDEIMEMVMFESVKRGVDMDDPMKRRLLINEIVEKVLGAGHPQQQEYEQQIVTDIYRETTLDETGGKGYYERMRGANHNEYVSGDITRR